MRGRPGSGRGRGSASVKVVQRRLGHSSAAMTLDVDSQLRRDGDDRSRTVIDALLGALADTVRTVGARVQARACLHDSPGMA
jgi:hypothetical protein